jgi:hypothetical protein
MPRLVHKKAGSRRNVWLDHESEKVAKDIDNLSGFLQMALKQASAIMAFDIIIRQRNLPHPAPPTPEQLDTWNENHPQDPLTQKRTQTKTWPTQDSAQQRSSKLFDE